MLALAYIVWLILNEKVTLECLLIGIPVAALAFLFLKYCMAWNLKKEKCLYLIMPDVFAYLFLLVKEVAKASVGVIFFTLKGCDPKGTITSFDSGLKTGFANAILANSITLTPGTITIEQRGSRFEVAGIDPEAVADLNDLPFIAPLKRLEEKTGVLLDKEGKK